MAKQNKEAYEQPRLEITLEIPPAMIAPPLQEEQKIYNKSKTNLNQDILADSIVDHNVLE
jgi:hypothetical protein